jgi:hypothetical protein
MTKKEDKMNKDKFWEIVEKLNYGNDFNDERCGEELVEIMKNKEIQEMEEFIRIFNKLYMELEVRMDLMLFENDMDYSEHIGCSDDELNDLLSHIIGMKKEEYARCYENIENIIEHANGPFQTIEGYSENFGYSLHSLYDLIDEIKKGE